MYKVLFDRIWVDSTSRQSMTHGISHWSRVERNGLFLCQHTDADPVVVRLFALFHDSMRVNDGTDPDHGKRGAEYAKSLQELLDLSQKQFTLLYDACAWHTESYPSPETTVAVCWDADRLDLGRVGIVPDPKKLFTPMGKQIARMADWDSLLKSDLKPLLPKLLQDKLHNECDL
jgi:uncharacterized protein